MIQQELVQIGEEECVFDVRAGRKRNVRDLSFCRPLLNSRARNPKITRSLDDCQTTRGLAREFNRKIPLAIFLDVLAVGIPLGRPF